MENLIQEAEKVFKSKIKSFPKFLVEHKDEEVRALIEQLCIIFVLDSFKKQDALFLLNKWPRIRPLFIGTKPFHIKSIFPHKNIFIDAVLARLKELEIYKINDKKTIYDYLAVAMIPQLSLQKGDITFLKNVENDPLATFTEWGNKVNLTRQGARLKWERLGERVYPQITAWLNCRKIKLRLLFGYVDVGKKLFLLNNLSKGLLSTVFLRSVGRFRSSLSDLYFTLRIPDDVRCQSLIEKSFKKMLDSGLIESFKLVEVIAVSRGINLEIFDVNQNRWLFNPEFWLMYLKNYLPEWGSFEESPPESHYEFYSSKIDKMDLEVIDALLVDGRIQNTLLAEQLEISRKTIYNKRKKLIKENFVNFYLAVRNMGLDGFFMLLLEGDNLKRSMFKKACLKFPQWVFYDYIGKGSVEGSVFAFEVPNTQIWKLFWYLEDLRPEFGIQKIWYDFFPIGSFTISNLIDRWNEKRQKWMWQESDFNLITLSEIERYL